MEEEKLKHVCKFCKKRFACGRSLGGHIRCHLPKPGNELKSSTTTGTPSSLSSETDTKNLRKNKVYQGSSRSRRSSVKGNNSNSSVSEVVEEEQQEEVDIALCLIMLSNDVGPWGGGKNLHGKSSKNKRKRVENVTAFTSVNGEKLSSEHHQKGLKMKGIEVSNDQSDRHSEKIEDFSGYENVGKGAKMEEMQESENEFVSADPNRNFHENEINSELIRIRTTDKYDSKRSKFECITCKKIFQSYQALGGHKASHKKLVEDKHCSDTTQSKCDKRERIIVSSEEQLQAPQYDDQIVNDKCLGSLSTLSKKVIQKHECPVCFRVFPSGQALGGHKRSHLLAPNNTEAKTSQSITDYDVTERSSSSETRDMLDLNLPPRVHMSESTPIPTSISSNSLVGLIKPHWWVENPHKHETLLSLI